VNQLVKHPQVIKLRRSLIPNQIQCKPKCPVYPI
jgi:hypothetical protein